MRELLDIKIFGGIVKNADAKDIPLNAASDSNLVDGNAPEGKLQGIPTYTDVTATKSVYNATRSAWIKDSSNGWNLVYTTTGAIKVLKDFYGTPTAYDPSIAYNGYSFVVHNQECRIACGTSNEPQWIGYCNYGQFDTSVLGWKSANAKIPQPGSSAGDVYITSKTVNAGTAAFDSNYTYAYTLSIIYDYTQESPLSPIIPSYDPSSEGAASSITLNVIAKTIASINPRITGIKIYRRETRIGSAPVETSLYRLLTTINIADSTAWTTSGGDRTITYNDTNDTQGASYEQETGIAETLTSSDVKYTLNTECNNYHFVAGCSKISVPDASHMIFRSLPYRYDMFDWSNIGSFVRLKTQPTALVSFNNRIWAFDENNIYKINPDSMIVEESIFGLGCRSQRGILVTPYGMFWENASNAYWHDGNIITPIGDAIKASSGEWHGFSTNFAADAQDKRPIVTFVPSKNYILFAIPYDTGTDQINVWAWHVVKKRWDSWTAFIPDCGAYAGMFTGKDGEVYISDGISKIYDGLGGATTRACSWTTKELDFDAPSQNKRLYKISVESTSTISLTYAIDGSSTTANSPVSLTTTGVAGVIGKILKTKIDCDATEVVTSFSVLFRRYWGNR